MATTYDLTNLNLPDGIYQITVKSKATGYRDSLASNAVGYSVGQVISDLNSTPWATISSVSQSGQAANYWAVGDIKDVALSGTAGVLAVSTTLKVFILEFDHNSAVEGTGISFGTFINGTTQCCLVNSNYSSSSSTAKDFTMNTSNTNSGGWKNCQMRYGMLGSTDTSNGDASTTTATSPVTNTLMSCFASELRSVMKPITKWSDNTGGGSDTASYVTATTDYLPLLSEYEVQGTRSYANSAEQQHQTRYAYYTAGNSKVKYKYNDTASAAGWWCRSVRSSTSANFCTVNSSGGATNGYACYSLGVAPAFLV